MRINRPGPRDRHFGGLWANSGLETYEFYLADCSKPCDGGDGDGDDDDRSLQKQDWQTPSPEGWQQESSS